MIFFFGELSVQICQEHDCDTYRPGWFLFFSFCSVSYILFAGRWIRDVFMALSSISAIFAANGFGPQYLNVFGRHLLDS